MKLTQEHIGIKVQAAGWGNTWIIPLRIEGMEVKHYIEKHAGGQLNEEKDGSIIITDGDNPWKLFDNPIQGIFDFSKFGCNEDHVRDLIKILDKRYARRK